MAFTADDMKALRLLLREELQAEVRPFRNEVGKRFDEVAQMDGLYPRDEKREQEYVSPGTDPTPRSQVRLADI